MRASGSSIGDLLDLPDDMVTPLESNSVDMGPSSNNGREPTVNSDMKFLYLIERSTDFISSLTARI